MPASSQSGAFAVDQSLVEIADLTKQGLRREPFLTGVLGAMRAAGFDRSRYYEVTHDIAIGEAVAFLVREDDPDGDQHVGFRVLLREATLAGPQGVSEHPLVARAYGDHRDPPWVHALGLDGRVWVEIPVTAGTQTVGILAGDWEQESGRELSESECEALGALGVLVGTYLGLKPMWMLEEYRTAREAWPQDDPASLIKAALPHLARELDSAVAAAFAFDWTTQMLNKVTQHVGPPTGVVVGAPRPRGSSIRRSVV